MTADMDLFSLRVWPTNTPKDDVFRINAGTGFRVVNLFTEEHAALNGAREVVIQNELNPEQSYNVNLNYLKKMYTKKGRILGWDISAWYTYFTNAILPDYDSNPNQIIYDNLNGLATSFGASVNFDAVLSQNLRRSWTTFQEVSQKENDVTEQQILTENFLEHGLFHIRI